MLLTKNYMHNERISIWYSILATFAWVTILIGLLSLSFIQQPLRWVVILLGVVITTALQVVYTRYIHSFSLFSPIPMKPPVEPTIFAAHQQTMPSTDMRTHPIPLSAPQVAASLELPFRHAGVRTENYREDIDKAVHSLCSMSHFDEQALSDCLHKLLQAAKQSWTELAAFSPREREILELLMQNISYKEMSNHLHVSISTIKTHVYHIFQKLEISNREEAVALIREHGWFS